MTALAMTGLAAIFVVGIVVVLTGSHDKTPAAASATSPAPSGGATGSPPGASGTGGSSDTALASLPGYTLEEAPASVISEIKQAFEEGMKSELKPGVAVDPDEVLAGISGRVVSRDGEEVALAVTMNFNGQWVAAIDSSDLLATVTGELGATEHVMVSGTDAVYATSDGNGELLAYKSGTFLIVITDPSDRATLNQVMAGLIAELG